MFLDLVARENIYNFIFYLPTWQEPHSPPTCYPLVGSCPGDSHVPGCSPDHARSCDPCHGHKSDPCHDHTSDPCHARTSDRGPCG